MSQLKQAERLEQLRFTKLINELNVEEQSRVARINADMAKRNLFDSGMRLQAIAAARADKIRNIIDGRLKIRRELCPVFPELCGDGSLQDLLTQFSSMIGHAFTALHQNLAPQVASTVGQRDDQEEFKLRVYATSEVEILRTEYALNLPKKAAAPVPTVSISGGTAIVNLGVIYGNVQQVIGKVGQTGDVNLEDLLSQLATAIRDSKGLGNNRATYLEQVQYIAEQAAEPEGQRKTSLVTGMFLGLQVSLQNMANVAQILTFVGPALARHFGISWPF